VYHSHGLGIPVAGQVCDLQLDQGSLDDGQVAVVIEPGGARGEPRARPLPRGGRGGAGNSITRRCAAARATPPQVREQPGQPGHVVAGVEDDQDERVAFRQCPAAISWVVTSSSGHRATASSTAVQEVGPVPRRDHRVRPVGDHPRLALAAPVDVARYPLRAGRRSPPRPVAQIDGQHQPAVLHPRKRECRHRPAQPTDGEPTAMHRVTQRAVGTTRDRAGAPGQQPGQRPDRPVHARAVRQA
jgi:hypothetical protein